MTRAEPAAETLEQLLRATAAGDAQSFRRLYEASSAHLFGLLMRMLKRRDWAEEALQDCYIKIWQKADTYAPDKGQPLTWLMTVARYRALDLLRIKRPEVEMPEEEDLPPMSLADATAEDPQLKAVEREGIRRLQECMGGLAPEQQRSVLLAYYEGYTHQEMAGVMKAPLGTVKSWVRRGLMQLRECMEK